MLQHTLVHCIVFARQILLFEQNKSIDLFSDYLDPTQFQRANMFHKHIVTRVKQVS